MKIKVRVPEVLQRYSGGEEEFRVEATTVAEALEALFARWPDLRSRVLNDRGELQPYLRLFNNDDQAALADPLTEGANLEIIGAAEGG